MAQNFRYRHGDTNPVQMVVESATVIEIGDLIYQDATPGEALPADEQSDAGSAISNQDLFKQSFVGVAAQSSRSGDTEDIRVNTSGVYEYPCASATFDIFDYIGPAENDGADGLENQKVVEVAVATAAIARVHRSEAVAVTKVLIDIKSTKASGGISEETIGSGS